MVRRLEKLFPPGYGYREEIKAAWLLRGLTVFISGLHFFTNLNRALARLRLYEYYMGFGEELPEGIRVEAFAEVAGWYWALWLPVFCFWAVMPLCHYLYYYRGTRSIYVMRRLPRRGVTLGSCVPGPALGAGVSLVAALLLYLSYYGVYCLFMTAK